MSEQSVSYMFGEEVPLASTPDLPPPPVSVPIVTETPVPAPSVREISSETPPRHWRRIGRGVYLQTLLQLKRWTDEQLVAAVHAYYPNSRTGVADVKFNCSLIARRVGVQPRSLRLQTELRELLPPPPWDERLAFTYGEVIESSVVATLNGYLDEGETITSAPLTEPTAAAVSAPTTSPSTEDGQGKELTERQPSRFRKSVDPDRTFDKTSLREASHGQWIHRDMIAHAFRWAYAGRYVNGQTDVLDVGCGPDVQMINVLTMPRNQVPRSYVGIDLNREPKRHPNRQWATLHWQFNFIERAHELGQFDLVTCFEMIEHMHKADGEVLLERLRDRLRYDGLLLLSTPVYNGKAAANHLHEWTISELSESIVKAGLTVEKRFGTFARATDLRKVASEEDLRMVDRLHAYYSDEVMACFLAPLYPDASRNNIWMLRKT